MQPIKELADILAELADEDHYLFTLSDLSSALPSLRRGALKALVGRAVKRGGLKRVCKGIYLYPKASYPAGLVLFHTAARLRDGAFNYISLESALSDAGVISQVPFNWITVISSGRSHIVDCGEFGHIEFIHTKRAISKIEPQITYDARCRMWRASVKLALFDMKRTGRSTDLVDWKVVDELV